MTCKLLTDLNMNPDDYSQKEKSVLASLDELAAAKRSRAAQRSARIVYWAGHLAKVVGELIDEYLSREADNNIWAEKEEAQRCGN